MSFALRTPPVLVANARVVDQRAPLHMHTFAIGSDRFCTATQVTQTLVRLGAKRRVRCRACVVVFRANGWYTNAIYRFRAMLCVNGISCILLLVESNNTINELQTCKWTGAWSGES